MTQLAARCRLAWSLLLITLGAIACQHDEHTGHDHAEEHGNEKPAKTLKLSPKAIKRSDIRVKKVTLEPLTGGIEVPAEIQADPDRTAHVSSIVSGQLDSVKRAVGDHVKEGDVLAVLKSVELGEARAALSQANADVDVATSNYERHRRLLKEEIGSERDYLEAKAALRRAKARQSAARRALSVYGRGGGGASIPIRSPISGEVVDRHATVGEVVSPSDVLFRVTDISSVWVIGRVYQQHAGKVEAGAFATLSLPSHPKQRWKGQLGYVAPSLDEHTRTLPVRLVLENADGLLKPGLFGTLAITTGDGSEKVAVVDSDAIQRVRGNDVVFLAKGRPGVFEAVPVKVGQKADGRTAVLEGLEAGQRYAASGAFVLKSSLLSGELGEGHAH